MRVERGGGSFGEGTSAKPNFLARRSEFCEVAPDRLIFNPPLSPEPNSPRQCQRTVSGARSTWQSTATTTTTSRSSHWQPERRKSGTTSDSPWGVSGTRVQHPLAERHKSTDKTRKKAKYLAFGEAGKRVWVKLQLFNHMWAVLIYY